ncbi:DUF4381 family protein [Lysobacter humi (ex Lee et al. 2017)]
MGRLVLRDVHLPPAPPWWPPAPGWWLLAGAVALLLLVTFTWRRRQASRRREADALFDAGLAAAASPAGRVAAASELLRRAARRRRPDADRLAGDDWLRFLDSPRARFSEGAGRRLLDGPFRPDLAEDDAEAVVALARRRFAELMGA